MDQWKARLCLASDFARPFTIYAGGVAVFVGVFLPWASPDKLWVAAALAGVTGGFRSLDKQAQTKADAEVAKAQAGQ